MNGEKRYQMDKDTREIHQEALWKQQQNVEVMENLREGVSSAGSNRYNDLSVQANGRLSRLSARMQSKQLNEQLRQQYAIATPVYNNTNNKETINSTRQEENTTDNPESIKNNRVRWAQKNSFADSTATNNADRTFLRQEKQRWVNRINDYNEKMAKMLKELESSKMQLVRRVNELDAQKKDFINRRSKGRDVEFDDEVEIGSATNNNINKNNSKSAHERVVLQGSYAAVERYLLVESPLRDSGNSDGKCHSGLASSLRKLLLNQAMRVHNGERLVWDRYLNHVQDAVRSYSEYVSRQQNDNTEESGKQESELLDFIKSLADPEQSTNVRSSQHHKEFCGTLRDLQLISKSLEGFASSLGGDDASARSGISYGLGDSSRIEELERENDELRSRLTRLRHKNAQLQQSAVGYLLQTPSLHASPMINEQNEEIAPTDTSHSMSFFDSSFLSSPDFISGDQETKSQDMELPLPSAGGAEQFLSFLQPITGAVDELSTTAANSGSQTSSTIKAGDDGAIESWVVPTVLRTHILRELYSHVKRNIVDSHPLASTQPISLVEEVSRQSSEQTLPLAEANLVCYLRGRNPTWDGFPLEFRKACNSIGSISVKDMLESAVPVESNTDDSGEPNDRTAVDSVIEQLNSLKTLLLNAVSHVVRLSSVHEEMCMLATLMLSFLHCRSKYLVTNNPSLKDEELNSHESMEGFHRDSSENERDNNHGSYPAMDNAEADNYDLPHDDHVASDHNDYDYGSDGGGAVEVAAGFGLRDQMMYDEGKLQAPTQDQSLPRYMMPKR